MATLGVFVGINKQLDTTIGKLAGAKRDAVVLWALFTDTLPDLSARLILITDERATNESVSQAVVNTLGAATTDDGRVLNEIRIISDPNQDDDWIEFKCGPPNPALTPFRNPGAKGDGTKR